MHELHTKQHITFNQQYQDCGYCNRDKAEQIKSMIADKEIDMSTPVMNKQTTLIKNTITINKYEAIERYNDAVLDRIQCDLKASDYEYCEDLINLGQELKRMHDNEFTIFFKDGATMLLLESDDFQLLEDNVDNKDFFFEIVVKDGDRVVELIESKNVTW
jgi:hypothetical protein